MSHVLVVKDHILYKSTRTPLAAFYNQATVRKKNLEVIYSESHVLNPGTLTICCKVVLLKALDHQTFEKGDADVIFQPEYVENKNDLP